MCTDFQTKTFILINALALVNSIKVFLTFKDFLRKKAMKQNPQYYDKC